MGRARAIACADSPAASSWEISSYGDAALAALLTEACWTNGQLARAVNRIGREAGLPLAYDDSAVCHRMSGTLPRPQVRPLMCEALSRRLGRPVTLATAGLEPAPASAAGTGAVGVRGAGTAHSEELDIVAGLLDLGSADMDPSRRTVLGAIGLYSAALAIPRWDEISGRLNQLHRNPHTPIEMGEVEAVRAVTEHLSSLDDQFGGRAVRPMAAAFLVNTIPPACTPKPVMRRDGRCCRPPRPLRLQPGRGCWRSYADNRLTPPPRPALATPR
ncbi:hypothetical protein ACQEU3_44165 [Spirillospora sp. CA-253888]